MLRKVLCPTDLTADSHDALACAIRIARENCAELTVFHVAPFPTAVLYVAELQTAARWQRLLSEFNMEKILASAEQRVRQYMDAGFGADVGAIAWRPQVTVGRLVEEITATALGEEVDLIVTGRCRKGSLARIFSGSVQAALLRTAPCPVLSVDSAELSHAERGWKLPVLKEVLQGS